MVITKTPYRVSLFGGGSDFPSFYKQYPGKVLGLAIDKYSYLMVQERPPLENYKTRVAYSEIEKVKDNSLIKQNAVAAVLKNLHEDRALDISHSGELPARNGLGSSSSFVVGLIKAIKKDIGEQDLAENAISIERNILQEAGGHQDQYWAACGGLNTIEFSRKGIRVYGWSLGDFQTELEKHILLVSTGIKRTSSDVSKSYKNNEDIQRSLVQIVNEAEGLMHKNNIHELGKLLGKNWEEKKRLSNQISNARIEQLYSHAVLRNFAMGGKICGAGAGGFMVFIMPPEYQQKYLEETKTVGFNVRVANGSEVIYG